MINFLNLKIPLETNGPCAPKISHLVVCPVSSGIFAFKVEDSVSTINQQEKTIPGLEDRSHDEWIERLRMYSEKKRELQNAREFDDAVHQELIKEFGV